MDRIVRMTALLLLIGTLPASADERAAASRAHAMVEQLHRAAQVPGLAVAVGRSEGVVWSVELGKADLENDSPVTNRTRFRGASVSKVLTAAALARLDDRGVIDLDAPIQTYLPDLPPSSPPTTLRLLSGHLGGVRHYVRKDFEEGIDDRHFESLTKALPLFAADELVARPGDRYHYSTFGYTLIGAAIEQATGKSFLEVMREEVFLPLGMTASAGDSQQTIITDRTDFYERTRAGDLVNADPVDPSYKWPGGGLLTSPVDLVRFGAAHLEGDFLARTTIEEMFTSQKTADGKETGVGLGWRIGRDRAGRRILHHSGSMSGARSSILIYPDDDLVLAIATNQSGAPAMIEDTLQVIASVFLGDSTDSPLASGHWTYEGKLGDMPLSGTMTVKRDGEPYATMSVGPELRQAFQSFGLPISDELSIPAFFARGEAGEMVLATSLGLLPVSLKSAGDGFDAATRVGATSFVFTATPAKPASPGETASRP